MDLPVIVFIQERLAESNIALETRNGTAFFDLFVKPQELMLQPMLTAMENILIGQSVRRVLALADPDGYDQTAVDNLVSNVYVYRDQGNYVTTTARAFYAKPIDKQYPAFSAQFSASGSRNYFNTQDVAITATEMALNISGSLYYFDMTVQSEQPDSSYNLAQGELTTFVNDADAVTVTNLVAAETGAPQEKNTALLTRAQSSIGVRDLETIKGINGILFQTFPYLLEIQSHRYGRSGNAARRFV